MAALTHKHAQTNACYTNALYFTFQLPSAVDSASPRSPPSTLVPSSLLGVDQETILAFDWQLWRSRRHSSKSSASSGLWRHQRLRFSWAAFNYYMYAGIAIIFSVRILILQHWLVKHHSQQLNAVMYGHYLQMLLSIKLSISFQWTSFLLWPFVCCAI